MALRLGAKDYLIKPLNSEHFLDSVRNVLLKMDKPIPKLEDMMAKMDEHFHMEELLPGNTELLNRLLENPASVLDGRPGAEEGYGLGLFGPYYAVIKLRINPKNNSAGHLSHRDLYLLRYGALNIVQELMKQEWNATAFYSTDREISVIVQWTESEYGEPGINKINQLEMIGRSLHYHIYKYLRTHCVVGISQILNGTRFLEILNKQAAKAIHWNQEHSGHYVFYYGDFNWNVYSQDPSEEELSKQSNWIVEKTKQYIHDSYAQKGLTIHEVAKKNHVSPNYLSYLYKKNTGYNLWEYVIKLRMEESRSLILNTDLRRYEIAEKVGYESPEHFSKIFKKYYGISPSELKK
ncbi:HTH-type transcriptional activator Btr [compost metagenome]